MLEYVLAMHLYMFHRFRVDAFTENRGGHFYGKQGWTLLRETDIFYTMLLIAYV